MTTTEFFIPSGTKDASVGTYMLANLLHHGQSIVFFDDVLVVQDVQVESGIITLKTNKCLIHAFVGWAAKLV